MELRAVEAVIAQEGAVALLVLQDRDRLVGALEREPEPLGVVSAAYAAETTPGSAAKDMMPSAPTDSAAASTAVSSTMLAFT